MLVKRSSALMSSGRCNRKGVMRSKVYVDSLHVLLQMEREDKREVSGKSRGRGRGRDLRGGEHLQHSEAHCEDIGLALVEISIPHLRGHFQRQSLDRRNIYNQSIAYT